MRTIGSLTTRRAHGAALAASAVAAMLLPGCGDLSHDELGRRVDKLAAIAAEGRLLARDVAHDRTKATFARVQARDLSESAAHEAEKVSDATPAPGSVATARRTVGLAERLSGTLSELATHPGDEARGARVGRELIALQAEIHTLAGAT